MRSARSEEASSKLNVAIELSIAIENQSLLAGRGGGSSRLGCCCGCCHVIAFNMVVFNVVVFVIVVDVI